MNCKLLALDMDGTTLGKNGKIHDITKQAILEARAKGVIVTLISGREPNSMIGFANELGIDNWISCMNGCIVCKNTGEVLYNKTMNPEDVRVVVDLCKEHKVCPAVFINNDIYVETLENPFARLMNDFTENPVNEVGNLNQYLIKNLLTTNINKIGAMEENDILLRFKSVLQKRFGNKLNYLFSLPFNIEIFRHDVNKGSALEVIAEKYGIERENIIAIGDGENDLGMLRFAKLGVAMGNAMDTVKKEADYITSENYNYGVAEIIRKFIL